MAAPARAPRATVDVIPVVDDGLGNSAYLMALGDGRALVVDASRDLRSVKEAADRHGLTIAYAADTHLHADFLSGARQLTADGGATILASAEGQREFPHRGLRDGDEVDLGGLTLRALATPGHTHEHIAFEVLDGASTVGVFTGGSLIVGSAARTDLVSPDRTEELARAQYRSLQRLARLDDAVAIWPTHGAGSFCSAPAGAERTSTIGIERETNPLLRAEDEDEFVRLLLGSLGTFPPYFLRLSEINRRGPALVDGDGLPALEPAEVRARADAGALVIDVRPIQAFAEEHVTGSISIPLRPAFATWLGWLVEPDRDVVILRNPDQDPAEIVWQSRKIGYDNVVGEMSGGLAEWIATGGGTASTPLLEPGQMRGHQVLDVRQGGEFSQGHLANAHHVELGSLATHGADLPVGPTVVMCGHGERAMGAASMLQRLGRTDVAVLKGGPEAWAEATGQRLDVSR